MLWWGSRNHSGSEFHVIGPATASARRAYVIRRCDRSVNWPNEVAVVTQFPRSAHGAPSVMLFSKNKFFLSHLSLIFAFVCFFCVLCVFKFRVSYSALLFRVTISAFSLVVLFIIVTCYDLLNVAWTNKHHHILRCSTFWHRRIIMHSSYLNVQERSASELWSSVCNSRFRPLLNF